MRKKIFLLTTAFLFVGMLNAAIINIPADYATIQEGLNAATEGDTVFVYAGTYVENIDWPPINGIQLIGENRSTTIIDGNEITSVIRFEEEVSGIIDSTTVIDNFTICNGREIYGGGFFCYGVSPCLMNLIIKENVALGGGGGIYFFMESNPHLHNIIINNNIANAGGGICCESPFPIIELENVTIKNNTAYNMGGGIYNSFSTFIFSPDSRCNIYSNTLSDSKGYGVDIYYRYTLYDTMSLVVDTFTVMNPTGYYATPVNMFNFDILHCITNDLINADVYVSIDGDNSNSGLSPNEPFRTIKYALSRIYSDSVNVHTIHLGNGVYGSSTNGEEFPIKWSNYVNLVGDSIHETILDAELSDGVMEFIKISDVRISDITIMNGSSNIAGGITCEDCSNLIFENVEILNCACYYGGGIKCNNSILFLTNVDVKNNSATIWGGGIFAYYSSLFIDNVDISMNTANCGGGLYLFNDRNSSFKNISIQNNIAQDGGGIYCRCFCPKLENLTMSNNTADYGGGIYCIRHSKPILVNSILWDDFPQEVYFCFDNDPNKITISYSDIQGGEAGIVTNNNGTVYWELGNIDLNPLFIDPDNGDYHLSWTNYPIADSTKSPCIDAGDPSSPPDPDGTIADMGAYYFDQGVSIDIPGNNPEDIISNFPNPAKNSTTIQYSLKQNSHVKISIYNIKGQLISTLVNEDKPKGEHSLIYNTEKLNSGVYFYKIQTEEISEIHKMIVIK